MRGATEDPNEMERCDTAFHDVILANAEGDRLKRMLTELREELIAYRFLSLNNNERREETIGEHEAILAALRAHDEDRAAASTAHHIAHARAAVMRLTAKPAPNGQPAAS
jgi:GntR family transcriptional repressor for pyruvate dehydrogenase complex